MQTITNENGSIITLRDEFEPGPPGTERLRVVFSAFLTNVEAMIGENLALTHRLREIYAIAVLSMPREDEPSE